MSGDPSSSVPAESSAPPHRWSPLAADVAWVAALVLGTSVLWIERITKPGTTYNMGVGDVFGYFLPAYEFEAERLAAGALPFWNPYQGAGTPFLAVLQPGALYPARLLLLATSPVQAIQWSLFGHVLLALLGAYALCRTLGISSVLAAMAAVIFATAFALPWIHSITLLEPGAWMPVLAVAVVKILAGGGWGWVLFLGAAAAMPILAGGYQMAVYICYGIAFVLLGVLLERRKRGEALDVRALGRIAVAGVLAVATAAPQLLPTLAWSAETTRQTRLLSDVQIMSLVTEHARWVRINAFFFRISSSPLCYFSIPVIALAAIGLVRVRPLGLVLGLGALATGVLSVVYPQSPLFPIYKAIPGLAMFRFPTRMLMLTALFTAVSAALGVASIARARPFARSGTARTGVEVAALAIVVLLLAWPWENTLEVPWRPGNPSVAPDRRFVPQMVNRIGGERVSVLGDRLDLRAGTFVRQGMRQRVRVLEDYEPLSSRRLATFLAAIAGMPPPHVGGFASFTGTVSSKLPFARPQLFDLVAVRAVQTLTSRIPGAGIPGWTRVGQLGDVATYVNANALPRAYVVRRARFASNENDALDVVTADDFDPRVEAALVGEPTTDDERAVTTATPASFEPRRIVRDDPEDVVIDVSGASGVLVLADAFAPGWTAEVDGAPRPLWQANYFVRAVLLEPGDREVAFRYRAPGFALGASLAIGMWTVALLTLVIARRRAVPTVAC